MLSIIKTILEQVMKIKPTSYCQLCALHSLAYRCLRTSAWVYAPSSPFPPVHYLSGLTCHGLWETQASSALPGIPWTNNDPELSLAWQGSDVCYLKCGPHTWAPPHLGAR